VRTLESRRWKYEQYPSGNSDRGMAPPDWDMVIAEKEQLEARVKDLENERSKMTREKESALANAANHIYAAEGNFGNRVYAAQGQVDKLEKKGRAADQELRTIIQVSQEPVRPPSTGKRHSPSAIDEGESGQQQGRPAKMRTRGVKR
jgi:hypothetical protein